VLSDVIANRETPARDFFWRARRGDRTWRAVLSDSMKLVSSQEGGQRVEWLFNLAADPYEENNLLGARPDVAAQLRERLGRWEQDVQPER